MNNRNPLFFKHAGQSLSTVLCFILPKMNLVLLVATALLLLTVLTSIEICWFVCVLSAGPVALRILSRRDGHVLSFLRSANGGCGV